MQVACACRLFIRLLGIPHAECMRRLERSIELKGGPFAMIMWMLPNKEELRAQPTRDKREAFFFFLDRKCSFARQIEYMLSKWAGVLTLPWLHCRGKGRSKSRPIELSFEAQRKGFSLKIWAESLDTRDPKARATLHIVSCTLWS